MLDHINIENKPCVFLSKCSSFILFVFHALDYYWDQQAAWIPGDAE